MRRHDRTEPSDMKIVFLDRATISPQTTLRPFAFAHELIVHERTATDDVARRIEDADIVITNKARLSAAALAGAGGVSAWGVVIGNPTGAWRRGG